MPKRQSMQFAETAAGARRNRSGFRPDVEGLRAVAIVLVVLYHCKTRVTGGYVGVDVFFVISGFLITSQLVRELVVEHRISFLAFYARRARRILPAATVCTIATVVASGLILSPLAALRVFDDAKAAALFGANFHFAAVGADYFNATLPPSPLQHYWSLSVEEQFYLVWPLLLVVSSLVWLSVAGRSRPRLRGVVVVLTVVAVLSLLASINWTPNSPDSAYYSIVTRAWELSVGALIALSVPVTRRLSGPAAAILTWIGLGVIALAAMTLNDDTSYPGSAAILPVAGAALIIGAGGAADRRWGAEALLGTTPFQRIGSWSYSWYLWHWPVLVLGAAVVGHSLSEGQALALAALALVLAVLSFVLVERPVRRMTLIVRRPAIGLAGAATLVATSLAVAALSAPSLAVVDTGAPVAAPAVGVSHRLTEQQLAKDLVAGTEIRKLPSNLNPPLRSATDAKPLIVTNGCHLQYPETRSKPCVYGDRSSTTSVVLFGDSHAATWFPALDRISRQQHWRLVDFTKYACPPPEVAILWRGTPYPQCLKWRADTLRRIAALKPALVIMTGARYLSAQSRPQAGIPVRFANAWQNGLDATFRFFRAHTPATHLILVSDVPTLRESDPDCVSAHPDDVRACNTKRTKAIILPKAKAAELAIAKQDHVPVIDPTRWFCAPRYCPAIVGNIILYRDDAHMVPAWSNFLTPLFSDAILSAMAP